jgi:polyhydroxybutyrate depolymerase
MLGAALVISPTATADTEVPADRTPATRCARPTEQQPGTSAKYELAAQGRDREYILHLPEGYQNRSDWPLIIAFHGRGGTGTEIEGYSGLSTLPAVVAYPSGELGTGDGYRRAWQGAPYAPPRIDDVAFTTMLPDLCHRQVQRRRPGQSAGLPTTGPVRRGRDRRRRLLSTEPHRL